MSDFDAIVVGAGWAGNVAAYTRARAGKAAVLGECATERGA